MTDIHFGTDGWRGRVAEDYTFDNVRRCTQGFASYLQAQGHGGEKVIVGHDQRFSGEYFAAAVAEVLAANGFQVLLTDGATPTPTISYAVVPATTRPPTTASKSATSTAAPSPPTAWLISRAASLTSGASNAWPSRRAWSRVRSAISTPIRPTWSRSPA